MHTALIAPRCAARTHGTAPEARTKYEMAVDICAAFGLSPERIQADASAPAPGGVQRPQNAQLDTASLAAALAVQALPHTPFRDGIRSALAPHMPAVAAAEATS